jgi:chromosome segregation ATPase
MSKNINELAEIETLQGAMSADDKRLRDAEEKVWPGATFGCDAAEKMADEILYLRQQLANAQREAVNLQKLHDHLRPRLDAAQGQLTRERLNADEQGREIETLRRIERELTQAYSDACQDANRLVCVEQDLLAEIDTLRKQLAGEQNRELERLWAFVELARGITPRNSYAGVEMLRAALDELDAGTSEPAPVAETLDAEGGA